MSDEYDNELPPGPPQLTRTRGEYNGYRGENNFWFGDDESGDSKEETKRGEVKEREVKSRILEEYLKVDPVYQSLDEKERPRYRNNFYELIKTEPGRNLLRDLIRYLVKQHREEEEEKRRAQALIEANDRRTRERYEELPDPALVDLFNHLPPEAPPGIDLFNHLPPEAPPGINVTNNEFEFGINNNGIPNGFEFF